MMKILLLFVFLERVLSQKDAECGAPVMLPNWDNIDASEGGTAIFRCPLDTSTSCLVDNVEWYRMKSDGSRILLRGRIEVFSFDPLLMYMTDLVMEDSSWYICVASNANGRAEAMTSLNVLETPGYRTTTTSTTTTTTEDVKAAPEEAAVDRKVALQMSTAVLSPVTETPPETTTSTTPRSNKWERFQVYSKYRGSRVSYPGAGYGAAYGAALSAANITLIPRYEEDMLTSSTPPTTTRRSYWTKTTTTPRFIPSTPYSRVNTYQHYETTTSPFKLYYEMAHKQAGHGAEGYGGPVAASGNTFEASGSSTAWTRGGKQTIPGQVAADLTHRDHLEAIHDHLRYIYDRMDDLLDRIHKLENIHRG